MQSAFLILLLPLLTGGPLTGNGKYQEYYKKGNVFLKNSMATQAVAQYELAIRENPSFAQAYLNAGICYDQYFRDSGKAVEYYVLYLQNGGEKVDEVKKWISQIAHLKHATTDREHGRLQEAMVHYNKGVALCKKEKYRQGIREFNEALAIAPYYVKARYTAGMAHFSLKQYADSYAHFMKVLLYDPDNGEFTQVYYYLGLLHDDLLLIEYGTALEFYRQYRSRGGSRDTEGMVRPLEEVEELLARGREFFEDKKFNDAILVLERGLALKPRDIRLYNNISVNCMRLKQYDRAAMNLKKALEIKKNSADTYYNFACLFSLTGEPDTALKYFSEGIDYYSRELLINSLSDGDLKELRKKPEFDRLVRSRLR